MKLLTITVSAIVISVTFNLSSVFGDSGKPPVARPGKLTDLDQQKRAESTIVEKLELTDTPVATALKVFTTLTGIRVKYEEPVGDEARITLTMSKLPASELLRYITSLANLKFRYEADGVHVTPVKQ